MKKKKNVNLKMLTHQTKIERDKKVSIEKILVVKLKDHVNESLKI